MLKDNPKIHPKNQQTKIQIQFSNQLRENQVQKNNTKKTSIQKTKSLQNKTA